MTEKIDIHRLDGAINASTKGLDSSDIHEETKQDIHAFLAERSRDGGCCFFRIP